MKLSYWDAASNKIVGAVIKDEDAMVAVAEQLLGRLPGKSAPFPGFELSHTVKDRGSLAVAVAPFGWALIHTAHDNLTQHCTRDPARSSEESVEVQWDEVTLIPRKWFITKDQAIGVIRQWYRDGTLTNAVSWSDQCY